MASRSQLTFSENVPPEAFSEPYDTSGYNDNWLRRDMITAIYVAWADKLRKPDSALYMRTLTGTASYFCVYSRNSCL